MIYCKVQRPGKDVEMFACTLITTVCTVLLLVIAYLEFRRDR